MGHPFLKEFVEESLAKAEGLITMGWIKGNWAVNAKGEPVAPEDESACKWCEEGAIRAATHHIGVNPETGQEDDPERVALRAEIRKVCSSLLQASDERHATAYVKAHKAHTKGMGGTSTYLDGATSGIPHVNDAPGTEHSFIVGAFQRARKLAGLARWPGRPGQ